MADTAAYFSKAFRAARAAGKVRKRTVFVVTVEGDDWTEPFGVYATRKRAMRALSDHSDEVGGRDYDIMETPVWK